MIKQIQKRVRGLLSSLVLDKTAAIFIENTRCNIVARCFSSAEWPGTKLHTWQLGISHLLASSKEPVCLLSAKKWANKKRQFSHGSPKNPWIWGVRNLARKRAQPTQGLQHTSFQKDQEGGARREMGQPRFFYSAHEWTCEAGMYVNFLGKNGGVCLQCHRNFGQASWVWNKCKLSLISHLTH